MNILITGSAGFIGYSLALKLLQLGNKIVGVDNHNNYYDPKLKEARLTILKRFKNYQHNRFDFVDRKKLEKLFKRKKPKIVINLGAQAGVRYSIENPQTYIDSNISGFANILECSRNFNVEHFVYASTSSVYGGNTKMPFSEHHSANHPLSLYAATKKSNEVIAHSYSHLYKLPTTGLRFFTVYGPWGRPDMALFKFTKNILEEKPIDVFNFGKHTRDFTYIDDIVNGVIKTLKKKATANLNWDGKKPDPASSKAPWRIYNIGNNKSIKLMEYINALEINLKKKAIINFLPLQPGDVPDTFADIKNLKTKFNYKPKTNVINGVKKFVNWFKYYYKYD